MSDLCFRPCTETLRDLSSMKVTEYLKLSCERMGSLPHTSVKTRPRIELARVVVSFGIMEQVCLPLRQGSPWESCTLPAMISILFTMLCLAMHEMAVSLRWPRWRCQVWASALEIGSYVYKVAWMVSPSEGKWSR